MKDLVYCTLSFLLWLLSLFFTCRSTSQVILPTSSITVPHWKDNDLTCLWQLVFLPPPLWLLKNVFFLPLLFFLYVIFFNWKQIFACWWPEYLSSAWVVVVANLCSKGLAIYHSKVAHTMGCLVGQTRNSPWISMKNYTHLDIQPIGLVSVLDMVISNCKVLDIKTVWNVMVCRWRETFPCLPAILGGCRSCWKQEPPSVSVDAVSTCQSFYLPKYVVTSPSRVVQLEWASSGLERLTFPPRSIAVPSTGTKLLHLRCTIGVLLWSVLCH